MLVAIGMHDECVRDNQENEGVLKAFRSAGLLAYRPTARGLLPYMGGFWAKHPLGSSRLSTGVLAKRFSGVSDGVPKKPDWGEIKVVRKRQTVSSYYQKRWSETTDMMDKYRKIVKEEGLAAARVACVPIRGRVRPRERRSSSRKIGRAAVSSATTQSTAPLSKRRHSRARMSVCLGKAKAVEAPKTTEETKTVEAPKPTEQVNAVVELLEAHGDGKEAHGEGGRSAAIHWSVRELPGNTFSGTLGSRTVVSKSGEGSAEERELEPAEAADEDRDGEQGDVDDRARVDGEVKMEVHEEENAVEREVEPIRARVDHHKRVLKQALAICAAVKEKKELFLEERAATAQPEGPKQSVLGRFFKNRSTMTLAQLAEKRREAMRKQLLEEVVAIRGHAARERTSEPVMFTQRKRKLGRPRLFGALYKDNAKRKRERLKREQEQELLQCCFNYF